MPTFQNPTADAAEASETLRGLAHATRVFEDPADTYAVLGDLLAGVRSLRQVLDQLATVHVRNQMRAYDDAGNQGVGASHALAAAADLRQAVALLDGVHDQLPVSERQKLHTAALVEPAGERRKRKARHAGPVPTAPPSGHLRDRLAGRIRSSPKAASVPTGCSSARTSTPAARSSTTRGCCTPAASSPPPTSSWPASSAPASRRLAKSLYTRSMPFGRRVYVPGDPKGEHTAVAEAVGGKAIVLGHGLRQPPQPAR
jgi:hypothetical protein